MPVRCPRGLTHKTRRAREHSGGELKGEVVFNNNNASDFLSAGGLLFFMFIRAQPYTCLGIECGLKVQVEG